MKDRGTIALLAAVAAGCILYGMLKENDTVFIIGLAFGIPAYLLFRQRYKEEIREKYGDRDITPTNPPPSEEKGGRRDETE